MKSLYIELLCCLKIDHTDIRYICLSLVHVISETESIFKTCPVCRGSYWLVAGLGEVNLWCVRK